MRNIVTAIIFLTAAGRSLAQIDSILSRAKDKNIFEATFVHTDKSNYVAGETIWLKACLYDGLYPSGNSSAIKIQLVTGDSIVVTEKIYPVISGIAAGNIKLPVNLKAGRYFLRAFGNASVYKQSGQCYVSPILINNPSNAQKIEAEPYKQIASVKLTCPDGLVAGQLNQAFVSIADQYKQPMQADGYLLNAAKDTVSSFSTNYLGIASLHIVPSLLEKYTIVMAGDTTERYVVPASSIHEAGVTMTVYYKDGDYNILLNATPNEASQDYNLIAEYNYNLVTAVKVHFNNNGASVKIPASALPAGINRLVLLNSTNDAVCARFIFSSNRSGVLGTGRPDVYLSASDTTASTIKFSVADSAENTVAVNVLDSNYNFGNLYTDENIINRFLLTAYFRDYNPAYRGIVDNLEQVNVEAVNGLLATQELLKPSWREMKQLEQDRAVNAEANGYINLHGTVTPDGFKSLPKDASLAVIFSAPDSSRRFLIVPLDNDGKFDIDDMVFSDSVTMYYKLNSKTPRLIKLNLEETAPQDYFIGSKADWHFLSAFAPVQTVAADVEKYAAVEKQKQLFIAAADTAKSNDLPNVTVHAVRSQREKTKAVNDRYTTTVFSREASATFNILDEPTRPGYNVIDYLRMFGRNMQIKESNGDGSIVKNIGWGSGQPYAIFADEGRSTFNYLKGLDMTEVALIKVYESNFILADNNGPAIAVYLRKGGDNVVSIDPQMQKIKIAGYSPVKSFVNPNAFNKDKVNGQSLLSTFYWNPNISFGQPGQGAFEFFNVNRVKKAVFVLQGMGSDGRLVYCKQTVTAK